ncbi:hypothetical protein MXB_3028 [Myxobolus squamalis]|nr:hypothetical protein MXB_3028 [Myxobolus squamalis]
MYVDAGFNTDMLDSDMIAKNDLLEIDEEKQKILDAALNSYQAVKDCLLLIEPHISHTSLRNQSHGFSSSSYTNLTKMSIQEEENTAFEDKMSIDLIEEDQQVTKEMTTKAKKKSPTCMLNIYLNSSEFKI